MNNKPEQMKFNFFAVLASLLILSACNADDTEVTTTTAALEVAINDTLIVAHRDSAPIEGGREVSVQPEHGEVLLDAFTIKYVPGVDFTGEDYLEVTNKASSGDANFYITSIDKYTITVTE